MTTAPQPTFIPAATLVLFRPAPAGPPELLMVERGGGMAFAAGAIVFPGGRVDPVDYEIAADPALVRITGASDPTDAAARVAAIRETIEEVGVGVAILGSTNMTALRAELAAGADFAVLLRQAALALDLDRLTPFAHWRPNMQGTRNFDTRFYVADAPEGAVATADGSESVHALWTSAEAALAEADAGRRHIIFPTRRNLERLGRFASIDDARADARIYPPRQITPWIEERDGERWLCIPEDHGYPRTAEPVATAWRS